MLRKFASLPQLNSLRNARMISTSVCGSLRSSEKGGDVTHTGQVSKNKHCCCNIFFLIE